LYRFVISDVICHRNEALEELIKRSARHSEIDLRKQKLTDLDMGIIVQKSIIERQCTVLQLQGTKITDQAISLLAHGLRNNTTLTKLNLNHNPISDVGVHSLAKLLAMNNTKIEKLYLCNIDITDQGAHYLAEMLRSNTTLEVLGVFQNQLSDQGMQELANVLAKHNTSLKRLYIQDNGLITDASVDSLIYMFNSNQSLIEIDMQHSDLSANGIQRLKAAANKKANFRLHL
jgi:Ran GTPase-activating protein (RanGAP) involved in mRNA processing and transport